jgi:phage gpG-like protein
VSGMFVVKGGIEFRRALQAVVDANDRATRAATAKGAHLIEAETKKKLTTSSHKRGTPTPSRPGEPPSLISGQLRRSIKVEGPTQLGPATYQAKIGPTAVYGRIQELGGECGRRGATTLPARPYLAPALSGLITSGRLGDVYSAAWRAAMEA